MGPGDFVWFEWLEFLADPVKETGKIGRYLFVSASREEGPDVEWFGPFLGLEGLDVAEKVPAGIVNEEDIPLGLEVSS